MKALKLLFVFAVVFAATHYWSLGVAVVLCLSMGLIEALLTQSPPLPPPMQNQPAKRSTTPQIIHSWRNDFLTRLAPAIVVAFLVFSIALMGQYWLAGLLAIGAVGAVAVTMYIYNRHLPLDQDIPDQPIPEFTEAGRYW